MALVREKALKTITDGLSWLATECELQGFLQLFDSNTISHELFCHLLNEVYDLTLVQTDRIKTNFPAIDLGDEMNKRCYQITTEKEGTKVQKTLDVFVQHALTAQYGKLQILIIGEKQGSYKSVKVPTGLTFDVDTDIVGLKDFLKHVGTLPTDKLNRVAGIVTDEIQLAFGHTDYCRPKLTAGDLECEIDPEGWATMFRLRVQNTHDHKTIEDVCIRVTGVVSIEGNDRHQILSFARPLLAISGTGRMISSPPETKRNVAGGDSVHFDVVFVHSHRKAGHSVCYGECVKDRPFLWNGNERWKFTHDRFLPVGKYKITLEVQGHDVVPIRKEYVFWGDKTGQHCVVSSDPSAQSTEALEFALIDLDTLPPEMHPHQLRVLMAELSKPDYDGITPEAAYRRIDKDRNMCGMAEVIFYPASEIANLPENLRRRATVLPEDEIVKLGGINRVPGFPNAIRRRDFEIAWQAVRQSSPNDVKDASDVNCDSSRGKFS